MSYGLLGLGTMGFNLALNVSKNTTLHVHNRTYTKVDKLMQVAGTDSKNIRGHDDMIEMVASMETPRTILTMLPHGQPTNMVVQNIAPLLAKDDCIIDCANELYSTSTKRKQLCDTFDIGYLGMGVSGGSLGALNGPALMVGGDSRVYERVEDFLTSFSSNCIHIDDDAGSGHFTKMVHNGVEYAMMQGIADIFACVNFNETRMTEILHKMKETKVDGYLTRATQSVFDTYNLNEISDVAEMNQTGTWCTKYALEHNLNVPVIHSAVNARIMSTHRFDVSSVFSSSYICNDDDLLVQSLLFVFATSVIEGLRLTYHKKLRRDFVQKAWSKGTIIECGMVTSDYDTLYDIIDNCSHSARALSIAAT